MPSRRLAAPAIFVLAGVNGAGKSSIGGAFIRGSGQNFFNPDEAARRIRDVSGCSQDEANSLAWQEGKRRLESGVYSCIGATIGSSLRVWPLCEPLRNGLKRSSQAR